MVSRVPVESLKAAPWNPRSVRDERFSQLCRSLEADPDFLEQRPILAQADGTVYAGNHRLLAARHLGWATVPAILADIPEALARQRAIIDNLNTADWVDDSLATLLASLQTDGADLDTLGFEPDELDRLLALVGGDGEAAGDGSESVERPSLADRFLVPPFSVLDARQGYWQERKRAWIALGIEGELGRGLATRDGSPGDARPAAVGDGKYSGGDAYRSAGRKLDARTEGSGGPGTMDAQRKVWKQGPGLAYGINEWVREALPDQTGLSANQSGTSIVDPVLCEIAYRWFCPVAGTVLNPMAGESVYGIVAAYLGYQYTGIELRPEQIESNRAQALAIGVTPTWIEGDGRDCATLAPDPVDFVFSCPPYADLEVYSDDPRDLSTMDYPDFLAAYRDIIAAAMGLLKPDRFACVIIGEVREPGGYYRRFVPDTIAAFEDAGARFYNEMVLVTAVGSLPIRVGRQFETGRKVGKTHQNVLVFCKGDWRAATAACGPVEVHWPDQDNA